MKEVPFEDKSGLKKCLEEKNTMQKVFHRNIVRYVDSFIAGGNKLYLIMEYCDKGDLHDYLKRIGVSALISKQQSVLAGYSTAAATTKSIPTVNSTATNANAINFNSSGNIMDLGEIKIWKYFIQICLALEVIHGKGIVHADLKPSNVLMSGRDYDLKLTDFGISQNLSQGYNFSHEFIGTLPYCSPEILNGDPYNQSTDIWALGCILYELCTRKRAFDSPSEDQLKNVILTY